MILLENCDYSNNIELLEKVKDQFSYHRHENDDGEAYHNVMKLLHMVTDEEDHWESADYSNSDVNYWTQAGYTTALTMSYKL